VLHHVIILGLPFLLPPCRFHWKAFFAILSLSCLNMWPIHFHFRYLIFFHVSFHLFLFHWSSFSITFSHHIPKVNPKYLFTQVCNFFWISLVSFHVSYSQSKTDLTLVLNNLILVFKEICFHFHMGDNCVKTAFAFLFLL
jgi:hypothetical protein